MKMHNRINGSYGRFYSGLNFERAGLFEAIKSKYGCGTVLYPGCSIHITPSFYFQHVVYVDISEAAGEFFQDTKNIEAVVNSSKKYKQTAYIRFINGDYTKELPVRENSYDLLISIYAGGITKSCKKYIKQGGIIVSNNHHNDVREALEDPAVRLEALIRRKGKKYRIDESDGDNLLKVLRDHSMPLTNLRSSGGGMEYVDNECYFVLRRIF